MAIVKPLPPAELTTEDLDIWVRATMEWTMHRTPGWVRLDAQAADRRDAELMWLAQTTNGNHVYTDGNARWGVGGDRAPMYDPQENWVRIRLNITCCA